MIGPAQNAVKSTTRTPSRGSLAAVSPDIWVAAACAAGAGFGNGVLLAGRANTVQTLVPDALRGRTFALIYAGADAAMCAGMVLAGLALGVVGARGVWLAAAALIALAAAGAGTTRLRVKEVRRMPFLREARPVKQ